VKPEVVHVTGGAWSTCALPELPPKELGTVRLVIVSDTHERHRCVAVPPGDILLHCGDIFFSSTLSTKTRQRRILQDFCSWLEELPHTEKVIIGGNHDRALDLWSEEKDVPAVLLNDSSVTLSSGLKVYGNPFSQGGSHNDAFQTAAPLVSETCRDADVVLTHQFCPALEEAVGRHCRPRLWASGHEHCQHGVRQLSSTIFVNAAIMNRRHNPHQAPVVVDLLPP